MSFTPPMRSESAGPTTMPPMPATMASTISRGILTQRRRRRVSTLAVSGWVVSSSPKADPTPGHQGKCREAAQNKSKRKSELLGHVARSIAFEIPRNHTDRAVYGYCGLQHRGCRFRAAARKKSARNPRAMTRGSDVCLDEVNGCHVATRLCAATCIVGGSTFVED